MKQGLVGSRNGSFQQIIHIFFFTDFSWTIAVLLNFSMWKSLCPLIFIDAYLTFMKTNWWMWAQLGIEQCISLVTKVICEAWHVSGSKPMKWRVLQSAPTWDQLLHEISGWWPGNCLWGRISASMFWKWCWKHWNITNFVSSGFHFNIAGDINTTDKISEPHTRIKMAVDGQVPHQRKSLRCCH